MPVTAKDIARELGLSQPTVSRVLNGTNGHRVSPETRARVLEAARRMQYQPNAVARSLRRGRTHCLGFHSVYEIFDYDTRNDFHAVMTSGLQRACNRYGFDLLLFSSFRHLSAEETAGKMRDGRIEGLFVHAARGNDLLPQLASTALRLVALADKVPNVPSVLCDNRDGIRQTLDYLWSRGYRRFAYLAPRMKLSSVETRRQTFETQLKRRGAAVAAADVFRIEHEDPGDILEQLESSRGQPLAVCCWNDRTAYNLLAMCREQGIAVPQQIAIVGFDGFLDNKAPQRELVTVRCPWDDLTRTALEVMVTQIKGQSVPQETCLPVELVEGDTA